nr:MAG TPA: D-3-phosphoglycerate dehydrogenase [Caudoviricetes sp.]
MFLLCDIGRDGYMDYKKEIIEMLEKIDNIYWLRSIYVFMKTLLS